MKDIYTFVNGCYWNITFGHPCRFNNDCGTDGSIYSANRIGCNESNESNINKCQCPSNKEYVDGSCQNVLTRLNGKKCCSDDCYAHLEWHLNTNFAFSQCKCKAGYVLYKDQCVSLHEAKICSRDIDCPDDFFFVLNKLHNMELAETISTRPPKSYKQCYRTFVAIHDAFHLNRKNLVYV